MPLSKQDRIAFSSAIIDADQQIKGLTDASAQMQKLIDKAQALDTANTHLFNPVNTLINFYQSEYNNIDGNVRSVIVEQDVVDSASKKLHNFFFPNDVLSPIPVLSAKNNVWTQIKPFLLAYGVGKNYDQSYTSGPSESNFLTSAQSLITAAAAYVQMELTTGQHCVSGSCSLPQYLTQPDCITGGGIWNPSDSIGAFPAAQTLKSSLVTAINGMVTQATAEAAAITAIIDSDPTRQAQNAAALTYINSTLLPALNAWLAYSDFNTAHGQTTCVGFYAYDSNLLAPTKLHSTQLSALSTVLANRATFLSTRTGQLSTNLGSIAQNIDTGDYSGGGFYKQRADFLNLRINVISGSLSELVGLQQSKTAQQQISNNLVDQRAIYMSILPTTRLAASGNGTAVISLVNASLYSAGDLVYISSDTQDEIVRAIKSISGSSVVLNDIIPTKYTTLDSTRLYKDLT